MSLKIALRDFPGFFEIVLGRGTFFYSKISHFALNVYIKKTMHFPEGIYILSQTLCVTFLYAKKQCTLRYVLYVNYIVLFILIANYKRTYNQSDQIDK